MSTYTIYIIDDEQAIRTGLTRELSGAYTVQAFGTAKEGISAVQNTPPDLLLLDIGLPDINGIDVLKTIKTISADIVVVMITAYEDINTVISAMKLGAYDYVVKPLHMDSLEITISNALETIRLRKEVQLLQEKYLAENLPCFVGESDSLQDVMELITKVAKSPDTPIMILGETGTGKELMASAIHYRSPHYKGPFVPVNCAAIPKDLVESELFGYEQGAFSGARASGKKGLIDEAAGGTLFLDEIGDLHLDAQAKLLRFLEDGEFYRVGGTTKMKVTTRIVSATNKNPEELMAAERFRADLYFRLAVIKIEVPSLNNRPDDIMPLAMHFLSQFSTKFNKRFSGITQGAMQVMMEHAWTGNVRELKNMIERGVLVGNGPELTVRDLDIPSQAPAKPKPTANADEYPPLSPEGIDLDEAHQAIEKHYIEEALRITGGNETKAAELLNMNRHTFRYRRKKCG